MVDTGKILLGFFCGAAFAFWFPVGFGVELSTWQSLELQIGLGSTVAVLAWIIPLWASDFAEHNKMMSENKGLTPEEIEHRKGLEEKARKKAQKK